MEKQVLIKYVFSLDGHMTVGAGCSNRVCGCVRHCGDEEGSGEINSHTPPSQQRRSSGKAILLGRHS